MTLHPSLKEDCAWRLLRACFAFITGIPPPGRPSLPQSSKSHPHLKTHSSSTCASSQEASPHLKFVQDNTPQLEGRAVQRQGFILPPFSTHVGAVQAVEAVQGVVELRNALAQVLVGFQAQGRHFDKDGVQLAVYHAPGAVELGDALAKVLAEVQGRHLDTKIVQLAVNHALVPQSVGGTKSWCCVVLHLMQLHAAACLQCPCGFQDGTAAEVDAAFCLCNYPGHLWLAG
eukprot:scaffold21468_cov16-Tisochrysis_lutea.AAC.1